MNTTTLHTVTELAQTAKCTVTQVRKYLSGLGIQPVIHRERTALTGKVRNYDFYDQTALEAIQVRGKMQAERKQRVEAERKLKATRAKMRATPAKVDHEYLLAIAVQLDAIASRLERIEANQQAPARLSLSDMKFAMPVGTYSNGIAAHDLAEAAQHNDSFALG